MARRQYGKLPDTRQPDVLQAAERPAVVRLPSEATKQAALKPRQPRAAQEPVSDSEPESR